MTPTIAIIVEGGMVRNTISDTPITAVVIDHDTEGTPDNELSHVDGVDTGVILSCKPHELDPHFVKQFREEEEKQERPFNLFRLTREWHDLSEEFWDDLSFRQQFELLSEMVEANAVEHATAMRGMAGALQVCIDQIQQMRGMFDDSDGTIEDALQSAEEALDSHYQSLGLKGDRGGSNAGAEIRRLLAEEEPNPPDARGLHVKTHAGLMDVFLFDAVEIHSLAAADEPDADSSGLLSHADSESSATAWGVFLHYKPQDFGTPQARGGLESVQDFAFDPSEPGAGDAAFQEATELCAQLADMIQVASPWLERERVISKANDPAKSTPPGDMRRAYVVIQEGGSSSELYVHAHDTIEDADSHRIDCARNGAYRTSEAIEIPASLAEHPQFFPTLDAVLAASTDLEYADTEDDQQRAAERPKGY